MNMKDSNSTIISRTTLTAKEAAEYLGISYWFVTQLVKRKKLPCIRMGNRLLFRTETLQKYLEKLEAESLEIEEPNNEYGSLRKVRDYN